MANRFFNPNEQFCDGTGTPYAGGSLAFYASGTSTPLNTYQDSALTIANTNPVVLDSTGRAGSIFLQNLAYKVVLSDVNNNQIWTEDPVYTSDYSARAILTSGAGSPNGSVAGTAGSPGIGASTYWDYVNKILYVCTTTGTATTAVWTAVNASTAAAVVPPPQGYLTPTSGTPIIPSDVIGSTSLVYTPYVGNIVPVYNGTSFVPTVFSELTLTLTGSNNGASTIYDVFVFNNSGVLTLVTGPAWSISTAGSCSRGTGAGTTALSRLNGIWVNAVSITGNNSTNSYTIPASQATYLGSIFIDTTAGQVTCHRSWGQSRKWGIWNAYNRAPVILAMGDSTTSWGYTGGTFRQSNNNVANTMAVFSGLAEDEYYTSFKQQCTVINASTAASGPSVGGQIAIGWNSTSVTSGLVGVMTFQWITSTSSTFVVTPTQVAEYVNPPALGINNVNSLEAVSGGADNQVFFGTNAHMQLIAQWRA